MARDLEAFDASRSEVEAALDEAAPVLDELDAAIHAAATAGISDVGIALESRIESGSRGCQRRNEPRLFPFEVRAPEAPSLEVIAHSRRGGILLRHLV
ncbi:hypothetical protein ACFWGP_01950 [Agromyces sp. NPDC127015]|uniref:hypothetical protein n=1 Tax=Agromyces sp. NPDC127015 TaxID=3347108 RepID=UPI003665BFB6